MTEKDPFIRNKDGTISGIDEFDRDTRRGAHFLKRKRGAGYTKARQRRRRR